MRKPNIDALLAEIEHHKSEKTEMYNEIDALKNQNMMLLESLSAITRSFEIRYRL